jgi:hypothetical protein
MEETKLEKLARLQNARSSRDQDRARRKARELLRDAPQQQTGKPAQPAAADNDQVDPMLARKSEDLGGGVIAGAFF